MKNEKKERIPLNLQFFAKESDPNADSAQEAEPSKSQEPQRDEPEPTVEEQLQQMRVENEKLKRAQEKAATDAADWKKKYNATLSDAQRLSQEKAEKEAEREEKFNQLLKENKVNKLEKNFLALGYPNDKATQAAVAQYDGDTDTLFKIQAEMQQAAVKKAEADWLKSRPPVNTGAGDSGADPFLQGFDS